MRWCLLMLGMAAALATTQCASPSSEIASTGAVSGSSTPSMASVTGNQPVGMYDPAYGRTIYNSATPPPGTNLNY
jgi:hypothetical protein